MVITSCDNAKVAEVVKLSDKKYRKTSGRYVIEGARLVADAFKYGADILSVFVSDKVFAKMSDTVTSQGILAVAAKKTSNIIVSSGNCIVLEGVQDPGNVGTLLRTAAACGFTDIYAVNSADMYSPKVLRSAMSAHFCLNIHECTSIEQAFELLNGVEIIACDMHGENVFNRQFGSRLALVLGNEGNGL